jgi:hypothetical protein
MSEEINKVKKRKVDLANKIRQFIQQGIQDLAVYQPTAPFKQIKFRTRLSQDLLPEKKMVQDNDTPIVAHLNYDRHIIGIGDYELNLEFYFIFSDGSNKKNVDPSKFKEVLVKPEGSIIRRVRVQYYDNNM